ncbi:maltose ABC transporter permease MalF [Roseateles amylovorans]|uniref:Maltose/maltodextrin transport system permease protein n=1 Tax=Roseateles amylovorans TaxID=2978473 RepID=A0ABY6B5D6_9BURK|nr:maltose ABC transporter permease MalF [Roseateles amylovorans]UXH80596.1 maltose ABC transporter permease MalF [Roseateles amylovorans]
MRAVTWGLHGLNLAAVLGLLFISQQLLRAHESLWAMAVLGAAGLLVLLQFSRRLQAWRYVMPGLLAVIMFIVLPMGFTLGIGFTNYSSAHLLSFERATGILLQRTESEGLGMDLALLRDRANPAQPRYRVQLMGDDGQAWHSDLFDLPKAADTITPDPKAGVPLLAGELPAEGLATTQRLDGRALVELLPQLQVLVMRTPEGRQWRLSSLHRISDQSPRYVAVDDDHLTDLRDGRLVTADHAAGVWRNASGRALEPGFRTGVGLANYVRIFGDRQFLEPFGRVFAWTVSFATLNTLLTFALGLFFAVALSWPALKGRSAYRIALFLPYAVPAFISIPVFRGLFNENLGEINLVLDLLFGVRPGWFSDATLARAMVLTVNTWLGYPYMMILAMGLLKAIPEDLYEASALAGAGPLTNLFRITLPLIARPMAPLLVASFAANFNNLTLIALLTEGAPDYLDTVVPVGATDLLASYTYRIAFNDGGQNYALACAISSIVFVIVALLAYVNLRFFASAKSARR